MQITGTVFEKEVSQKSKSHRKAFLVKVKDHEYVLRRKGGNPFHDEVIAELDGKKIRATGFKILPNIFVMDTWTVLKGN